MISAVLATRALLPPDPALLRLQQRGWIKAAWGASENNRRAKYYSITKRGLKQLAVETEEWERISQVIARLLGGAAEGVS